MTGRTVAEWLEELANDNTSTEADDIKMTNLLHTLGFPKAISTCGITYFDGHGTIEAPPMPINQSARILLDAHKKSAKVSEV